MEGGGMSKKGSVVAAAPVTTVPVAEKTTEASVEPKPHEWTHTGKEVLVVRFCAQDGTSYGGFKHPVKVGETVTAPDWESVNACGRGIHGWPWGFGLGDGKECDWSALWQVYRVKPEDI